MNDYSCTCLLSVLITKKSNDNKDLQNLTNKLKMKQFQLNEDFVPCPVLLTIYDAAPDNAIIFHFLQILKKYTFAK